MIIEFLRTHRIFLIVWILMCLPFSLLQAQDAAPAALNQENLDFMMMALKGLLLLTVVLALNILRMVFNLRDSDPFARVDFNTLNARILAGFVLVGMILALYYSFGLRSLYLPESASAHGINLDKMFNLTLLITGIVVIITHLLLVWFTYNNRWKENRKAIYYPDNNKLEMMWTIAPAIVLTVLVLDGAKNWNSIMSTPPEDAIEIELTGKQFAWNIRYAGSDEKFGKTNFRKISATNELGFDWSDDSGKDDVMPGEIYMPVNRPVLLKIRARDVLHSVYLPHFRVKMDAVPGMPTQFWFTPIKTTKEMRTMLKNENFNYELACTEICGRGHFSMKRTVVVVTEAEYREWLRKQKPYFEPEAPAAVIPVNATAPAQDSTSQDSAIPAKPGKDKIAVAGKLKKSTVTLYSHN